MIDYETTSFPVRDMNFPVRSGRLCRYWRQGKICFQNERDRNGCPFEHSYENVPTCHYWLLNKCNRRPCRYVHFIRGSGHDGCEFPECTLHHSCRCGEQELYGRNPCHVHMHCTCPEACPPHQHMHRLLLEKPSYEELGMIKDPDCLTEEDVRTISWYEQSFLPLPLPIISDLTVTASKPKQEREPPPSWSKRLQRLNGIEGNRS